MGEIDIKTKLFSAYQEYIQNFYPNDPNIYVIRAHPGTIDALKKKSTEYQVGFSAWEWGTSEEPRFLGFRYKPDLRFPEGDIIVGPETLDIKWSK